MKDYKYLFGPVPSRRFGRSLGIDLVPFKTCSYDCVFCQLGRTTQKTVARKTYIPVQKVIDELKDWVRQSGNADHITLSGSGEPTLHTRFGDVIEAIRALTDIPVVLLTNGSLLNLPEVSAAAKRTHKVKASLSAWDQQSLEYVNRPHSAIDFTKQIEGLRSFRKTYSGEFLLEVFIVWGMNSIRKDVAKIADIADSIGADQVQLNTAIRPAAEEFVEAFPAEELEKLRTLFDTPSEVVAKCSSVHSPPEAANKRRVLALLQRRPCSGKDISEALGLHLNEASKYLGILENDGWLDIVYRSGMAYYRGRHQRAPM